MTPARFRKLALSLEGVSEVPHMNRAAFRTKRKIIATLGKDKRVNMMVQPGDRRDSLIEAFPDTFFSLGGWSRLGYLAVDLASVEEGLLRELLDDAWRDALPVAKAPRKKIAKKKTKLTT
jgi:hypothetical protein